LPLDLSDRAIAAAVFRLLDEIEQAARDTKPAGKIHARDLGRSLGLRIGIPTWQAQRIAKAWRAERGWS